MKLDNDLISALEQLNELIWDALADSASDDSGDWPPAVEIDSDAVVDATLLALDDATCTQLQRIIRALVTEKILSALQEYEDNRISGY